MRQCIVCELSRTEADIKPIYVTRERTVDVCSRCSNRIFKNFTDKRELR